VKHSKKFAGKHHPGMEDLLSTTFVLFSQQEQGRLLAARSSLADAAGWGSMKLYKEQPEGAEAEARKEIYQQVRAQLAEMGTPISEDEALLASLQTSTSAAGNGAGTHVSQHISLNGGQPHDDSGDEWHSASGFTCKWRRCGIGWSASMCGGPCWGCWPRWRMLKTTCR
jgi:hypothetical protein